MRLAKGHQIVRGPNFFSNYWYVRTYGNENKTSFCYGRLYHNRLCYVDKLLLSEGHHGEEERKTNLFFNGFLTTLLVLTKHSVTVVVADGGILVASFQASTVRVAF